VFTSSGCLSLQDLAEGFQRFISRCSCDGVASLDKIVLDMSVLREQHLLSIPEDVRKVFNQITRNKMQEVIALGDGMVNILDQRRSLNANAAPW